MNILLKTFIYLVLLAKFSITYAQVTSSTDSIHILLQNYQYGQALDIINRQLLFKPGDVPLCLCKGSALKGLLKYPDALEIYKTILEKDPTNYTALIESSGICKSLGEYEKALTYLEVIDRLSPDNTTLKMEIANVQYNNDHCTQAKNIYQKLYANDTLNVILIKNIAKCYDNLEQTDSAIYFYAKAISLNNSDYQSYIRLINIYIEEKNYPLALATTEDYKTTNPDNPKINSLTAFLYLFTIKYHEAIDNFNRCIQHGDSSKFNYKYLGIAYSKIENYDSAKVYLEKAFRKDTTDAVTAEYLGIACSSSCYVQLGVSYFDVSLRLRNPTIRTLSSLYKNTAEAYNKVYRYQDALNDLLLAYELNPADTLLVFKIGSQYDDWLKKPELALIYYEKFMKTRPEKKGTTAPVKDGLTVSYYDAIEKRIKEIRAIRSK
jgi:tetratricopeptide (TPR) repeat protein